ncbi:polysaccharide biosynthesis/export family protein [Caulobacter sp. KR2-114]|uniref:polysaccharide biosynthesis/export family protein n=1 Tax=Caulobacter sp. KR2-114 TaxID=3400912 RepID=UPI003BFC6301
MSLTAGGAALAKEKPAPASADLPAPDPSYASLDVSKNYRIGPLDKLDISVFQVDELKTEAQVDASGNISLPLIGSLTAAGKTTSELSAEIAQKLDAKYLKSPQVTVLVKEAEGQKITVGGAVQQGGVFDIQGRSTLMQAVALAHGPDHVADLKHVSIFRTVNGQKFVATVDLRDVQKGRIADPVVYGNDTVIVGTSGFKSTVQTMAGAAPILEFLALVRP